MSANRLSEVTFAPEKYKLTALYALCSVGGFIGVCDGLVTSGRPIRCAVTFLSGLMTLSLVFYLSRTKNIRRSTLLACLFTGWVFLTDFILYADPYYLAIGFSVPISAAVFLRSRDALHVLFIYGLLGLAIGVCIHSGWLGAHYPPENVTVRTITAMAIISAMAGPTMLMHYLLARSEAQELNQRVRFETVCDVGYGALCEANDEGTIVYTRGGLLAELGYESSDVLGRRLLDFVHAPDRFGLLRESVHHRLKEFRCDRELQILDATGRKRWVRASGGACHKANDKRTFVFALQDINDAVEHRQRMFEVSRLQSLGNLCGGLAHDFNNLMTVIGIHASDIADNDSRTKILAAQKQAADLTAGLLAFARKQTFREQDVELCEFLISSRDLIEKLLPANVRCDWNFEAEDTQVRLDPAQLQQVLLNVVTNAKQAMPDGGMVRISLTQSSLSHASANEHQVAPGRYAALTVSDDGHGMDAETASRSIEPFFTTKPRGVGTGLGLASAHGTAKRVGGTLIVRSQPNLGTDITMLFPLIERAVTDSSETDESAPAMETKFAEPLNVVFVEDHPIVAATIEEMLEDCGHQVRLYGDAESAWEYIEANLEIDLLVSDVMLPGMSGVELVKKAMTRHGSLKSILISGYLTDDLDIVSQNPDSIRMLAKPFCREQLESAIAEVRVRCSRAA